MEKNTEKEISKREYEKYPVIPMRGVVAFPNLVVHFDVVRDVSINAMHAALKGDRKIFVVTQKDVFNEEPSKNDLYKIGVIAEIRQVLKTPDGVYRVLVEGISKAKMVSFEEVTNNKSTYYEAEVKNVNNNTRIKFDDVEIEALMRTVKETFERYSEFVPRMPSELVNSVMCQEDPEELFENIVFNANLQYTDKQELLEQNNVLNRLTILLAILSRETEVLEMEHMIYDQVKETMSQNQREFILREQMKAISTQLGEEDDPSEEVFGYNNKIDELNLEEEIAEKLKKEAQRLSRLPMASQEAFVIKNYLDTVLSLPWNKETSLKLNIRKAEDVLEKDHYGLKKVKERILESIAVHAMKPDVTGQIICLVGPPGVGKTSIGRSIAKALGREYVRISLGGVRDESDIRGHRKTYVGAMPGRIINAMIQANTKKVEPSVPVPRHKGLRIARLVETSNAESPTLMIYRIATIRAVSIYTSHRASLVALFLTNLLKLRSSYDVKTKAYSNAFLSKCLPTAFVPLGLPAIRSCKNTN